QFLHNYLGTLQYSLQLILHTCIYCLFVPSMDVWDSWGPYGECSRSCGGGVTTRTRRCVTHRTDGGHNCVGPDKSYRSCNIQDCPEGSRDFREEQCSQFDGTNFQRKRYKWLPYYGAENPCELNCMPRGENFYYRHRSAVVDGTPCHPGRRDICVGGVCKVTPANTYITGMGRLGPGGHMGLWTVGDWNACSVTCGGGSQTRSVQCVSHDASGPRVVEDALCAAYAEAPPSLQTCNMQTCAEYHVTGWSAVSTRIKMILLRKKITDLIQTSKYCSNSGVPSGPRARWHGFSPRTICSVSCGSGEQTRSAVCSDQDRNLYPVERCGVQPRPATVERCNSQPCRSPQVVPSVQDPQGHDPLAGFQLTSASSLSLSLSLLSARRGDQTNTIHDPHSSAPALHCSQSPYGCCPDRRTAALGPRGHGCPRAPTPGPGQYGCCQDGLTAAQGPSRQGCMETAAPRSVCSLPRAAGSCSSWVSRYHFDILTSKCTHFWFGGCHGNGNNFLTRAECQRMCPGTTPAQRRPDSPVKDRATLRMKSCDSAGRLRQS
uniref:Papilin a, proteoglycan-like sulfated glycoprotein n=1 Tax=Oryzias latipes TaxID=8090 RepID=A0A3P9ILZ4_ORYLA